VTRTERTRAALLDAAFALFGEQGFETTTVAQIADRAGVTEMTFYRHFGTKDALVVDDPYDPLMADAVIAADPELPPLPAIAAGVRAAWRAVPEPDAAAVRDRLRFVASSPSLRAAMAKSSAATEAALADALQRRGADTTAATVAAAAAVAALNGPQDAWAEAPATPLESAIDLATDVLSGAR